MKKLIATVILLMAPAAFANCIVDGYGHGVCGEGPCIVDGYGHGLCASACDQQCIVDGYGHGVCG